LGDNLPRRGKDDRAIEKKGVTDVGKNVSYRDILRHNANRMSQSQIASACGCARSTVQDVLKQAAEKGVSCMRITIPIRRLSDAIDGKTCCFRQ